MKAIFKSFLFGALLISSFFGIANAKIVITNTVGGPITIPLKDGKVITLDDGGKPLEIDDKLYSEVKKSLTAQTTKYQWTMMTVTNEISRGGKTIVSTTNISLSPLN